MSPHSQLSICKDILYEFIPTFLSPGNLSITELYSKQLSGDRPMRTTKILAFSVPPDFENQILKHAKMEHRTLSEYLREAVRHYMTLRRFESTRGARRPM